MSAIKGFTTNLSKMKGCTQMEQVRFLRLKAVVQRSGLSRATLYRKIADGTFPTQVHLGARAVGWRAEDLEDWCRDPVGYHADL
jgi:prophage regulatory protein